MAEMLCTVVTGEAVNRTASLLLGKEEREAMPMSEGVERLELAHIKMEAALEASRKWPIVDVSLVRWRKMLSRAADESEEALQRCRRSAIDAQEADQKVTNSSFPRRITHATMSCISSFANYFIRNIGEPSSTITASAVRRFERFADSAGEFIRFVELGGAPRQHTFHDPLIGHLLAGKELNYEVSRGSQRHFFGVRPVCFDERGVEAKLCYDYQDQKAPENSFVLGAMLRLSESTDIIGVMLTCLQTVITPHFGPAAETVRKELTQLPTQDFSCRPYVVSKDIEHWNYHNILTEWFRPDPGCCKHQRGPTKGSNSFPEQVIELFLQRNMLVACGNNRHLEGRHILKLGALFTPHASPEDLQLPKGSTSTTRVMEVINGQAAEHSDQHTGVSWQAMSQTLLPKAIEYLCDNDVATTYQLFWESMHGTLQLSVEKIGTQVPSRARGRTASCGRGRRRSAMVQHKAPRLVGRWKERKQIAVDLLKSWAAFAPDKMQGSITAWIERVDNTRSI